MNAVSKLINYLGEVKAEIKKVVWPKRQEVIRLTLVVFVFSGIVAAYVGILDFAFTKLLELFVKS